MKNINKKILKTLIEKEVSNYIDMLLEQAAPEPSPPAETPPAPDAAPPAAPEASAPAETAPTDPAVATSPPADSNAPAPSPDANAAPPSAAPPTMDADAATPPPMDASVTPPADAAEAPSAPDMAGGDAAATPPEEDDGSKVKQIQVPQGASPDETEKVNFNNKLITLVNEKYESYKNLGDPVQYIWNDLKAELTNSGNLDDALPTLAALSSSTDQIIRAVAKNLALFILVI